MRIPHYLYPTILAFVQVSEGARKLEGILLSNVKTLTLRKDQKTTHNRVAAVPQVFSSPYLLDSSHTDKRQSLKIKCIGGNAKELYDVDIMRCKNQGSDYDDENIQWTCSASLPPEFKLGSTDVICEGFASSSDSYVLKGSCGVEYRLILTTAGEEKYGQGSDSPWDGFNSQGRSTWPAIIFWCLFISAVGLMIYSAFTNRRNVARDGGGANPWGGWDGGGGGGGGADDPPPPYQYQPSPNTKSYPSRTEAAPAAQQGWRPGFWSGVLGGGAAGYMATNRAQNQQNRNAGWFGGGNQQNYGSGWENNWNSNGEGSSGWGGGARTRSSGSSSSSFSSTRHESSGFGSTSRR